jgi:hypothetical protein
MKRFPSACLACGRLLIALLATAFIAPVKADTTIINTFTGTVGPNNGNPSTPDIYGWFGGGDLTGQRFTLTYTFSGPIASAGFSSSDPGGPFYPSSTSVLMTSSLTINGYVATFVEGGPPALNSQGVLEPTELNWLGQIWPDQPQFYMANFYSVIDPAIGGWTDPRALELSVNLGAATPADFSAPLPTLSGSQIVSSSAYFCDSHCSEMLWLNIDGVNLADAVPEPSTWAMMLPGFAGLGFLANRRSKKAAAA